MTRKSCPRLQDEEDPDNPSACPLLVGIGNKPRVRPTTWVTAEAIKYTGEANTIRQVGASNLRKRRYWYTRFPGTLCLKCHHPLS
jgi:hypothetical protein